MALTLACAAFAQSGMSYLEGNVKGVDELKTDKKGHWMQAGISLGGIFTVSVLVDGKVADVKHKVKPGTDGGIINFDLSKPKAKA